ncbi:fibronectin type III domain-containing protein [Streptomyces longwoodensis]|uniref:fibronectin type III domain-containing protein n=1 Tax=Streptomyces longwoodensis TaxID=68231 RepID=UPI003807D2E5
MPDFIPEGSVNVPVAGRIKKAYIYVPAAAAAAYVGWRWYRSGKDSAEAPAGSDGMYSSPDLSDYGLSTTGGAAPVTGNQGSVVTDGSGGALTTNDAWTDKAVEKLTNQGYDGQAVLAALGEFLARRSLDPSEARIARAALAAAGQPPVGGPYSVIEAATTGTATPAAPSGLRATAHTDHSVNLAWNTAPGITQYAVYRSDTGNMAVRAGAGSTSVYGLKPNTSYTFTVAAVGSTGKIGPKSNAVTVKTSAARVAQASTPTVSAITRTSFRATTKALAGASRYRWLVNGREVRSTEVPWIDLTGLKPNTTYAVAVLGDDPGAVAGAKSGTRSVKTKK